MDVNERYSQDIAKAMMVAGDTESVALILAGGLDITKCQELIQAEKMEEALELAKRDINNMEQYLAVKPQARDAFAHVLSELYFLKMLMIGGQKQYQEALHVAQKALPIAELAGDPERVIQIRGFQLAMKELMTEAKEETTVNTSSKAGSSRSSVRPHARGINWALVIAAVVIGVIVLFVLYSGL